jgi:hypothetical protein
MRTQADLALTVGAAILLAFASGSAAAQASIESDADGSIVLSVPENAVVSIQYGNGPQILVATQADLAAMQATVDALSAALADFRNQTVVATDALAGTVSADIFAVEERLGAKVTTLEQWVADEKADVATIPALQSQVDVLSVDAMANDACFVKGTFPGSSTCVDNPFKGCNDDLVAPTNGAMLGSSTAPGATRRFSCDDGFLLTGHVSVHCVSDGTWDAPVPTCSSDPSQHAHQYWRVTNRAATGWRPVVGELQFWTETKGESCGGLQLFDYSAAENQPGFENYLCSKQHAPYGNDGACFNAVNGMNQGAVLSDGISRFSFRPACNPCRPQEVYLGVKFHTKKNVGCVQVFGGASSPSNSLGRGTGAKKDYSGGLAVEASDDGVNWIGIRITVPGTPNMASVIDGTSCNSWSCCEGEGCDQPY